LDVAFRRAGAQTVLERHRICMPLALQRPFYPEGTGVCHVLLLHPPGGMVGGDRLDISIDVADGAEALISTPSAAKWYRGHTRASQFVTHRLAAGAKFEWLPQETIVFDGADVEQRLRVDLAPGATWFGWDITRFGRSARGETFRHGHWRMNLEVWRDDVPLWIDRQRLDGGATILQSAYGLGNAPVVGTLAWIGKAVTPDAVESARELWNRAAFAGDAGVTRLELGLLCRYRGPSSADARAWFSEVWKLLRARDGRGKAVAPRIWNT
jgi:urease accessory protein